jgi:hypothetical protein
MKKIVLGLSFLLSTQLATATTQVTPYTTITEITSYPSSVIINTASTNTNKDNCTSPKATTQLILPLNENSTRVYAAILSAYVAGEKVRLVYDGCVATIPLITRTDIKK